MRKKIGHYEVKKRLTDEHKVIPKKIWHIVIHQIMAILTTVKQANTHDLVRRRRENCFAPTKCMALQI